MRAAALAIAVVAALLAAGATAQGSPGVEGPQSAAVDPLKGWWDTGRIPMSTVRAAVLRAGYTNAEFNNFLRVVGRRSSTSWETRLVFYRVVRLANAPYVKITGWDPTRESMPGDGDHGPYALLPQQRVAITSADPDVNKYREVYSYRIDAKKLTLRPVSISDPTKTKAQLRLDKLHLYVIAAAPFTKIK